MLVAATELPAEINEPVSEAVPDADPLGPLAVELAAAVLSGATLETVADTFAGVLLFPLRLMS